jgi:hypothetical protein
MDLWPRYLSTRGKYFGHVYLNRFSLLKVDAKIRLKAKRFLKEDELFESQTAKSRYVVIRLKSFKLFDQLANETSG